MNKNEIIIINQYVAIAFNKELNMVTIAGGIDQQITKVFAGIDGLSEKFHEFKSHFNASYTYRIAVDWFKPSFVQTLIS